MTWFIMRVHVLYFMLQKIEIHYFLLHYSVLFDIDSHFHMCCRLRGTVYLVLTRCGFAMSI